MAPGLLSPTLNPIRFFVAYWLCWVVCMPDAWAQPAPITLATVQQAEPAVMTQPLLVPDNRSGAFCLYLSNRGHKTYSSLYIQHIMADGSSEWPDEGQLVCPSPYSQQAHVVLEDGKGGVLVAWVEQRQARAQVFVQYLNPQGQAQWPITGLPVSRSTHRQLNPRLALDYKGGFYVCWEEEDPATAERDVYAQRISQYGGYLWGAQGISVCEAASMQQNIHLAATPAEGLLVLWEDFRNGKLWTLYVQQLSESGVPSWAPGGIALSPDKPIAQRYPSLYGDGFGGLVCVYEAYGPADKDLFAVRINRQGKIVYQHAVCEKYGEQTNPQVLKKGAALWVVWEDYHAGKADIIAQQLDITSGQLLLPPDGIVVNANAGDQVNPQLTFSALVGEPVVMWENRRGDLTDIQLQKLSTDGRAMWHTAGTTVVSLPGSHTIVSLVGDERGGVWLSWVHPQAGGLPLVQQINSSADKRWPLANACIRPPLVQHAHMDQATAVPGFLGDAFIAWEDYRNGEKNPDIYLQRIDSMGRALWPAGGIVITAAESYQSLPVLCPVPGGVFVGWLDRRSGSGTSDDIYLQFIDNEGHAHMRPGGMPLCIAERSQNSLRLAAVDDKHVLAVWTDARAFESRGFDIYMQRVSTEGQLTYPQDGTALSAEAGYETGPALCTLTGQGVAVAWMQENEGLYQLRVQYLDGFGMQRWQPGGLLLAPSLSNQRYPVLASRTGREVLVVWSEEGAATEAKLYGQLLNLQGQAQWTAVPPALVRHAGAQTKPQLLVRPTGFHLQWLDERDVQRTGYNLYSNLLDWQPQPQRPWPATGKALGNLLPENAAISQQFTRNAHWLYSAWISTAEQRTRVYYTKLNAITAEIVLQQAAPYAGAAQRSPQLVPLGRGMALVWIDSDPAAGASRLQCLPLP